MKGKKCFGLLLALPIMLGLSLSVSLDANAANITTNGLNFYGAQLNLPDYSWTNYIEPYHELRAYRALRSYGMRFNSIYSTGNYASMHFETNLVTYNLVQCADDPNCSTNYWINRDYLRISGCSFNNGALTIQTQTLNTAVTKWIEQDDPVTAGLHKQTLTLYGDVTFSNVPTGTTGNLVCDISTSNGGDFLWSNKAADQRIYWEKNPTILVFGSNINDALLQTQIEQNETIINQNQYVIDQDNQDRQNLENNVDDAELQADNAGQQFETGIAPLTTIIGNFVNIVLNPPSTDCTINGNVGIGNFDMGTIDLCQLSPPPAVQIIATLLLIGFIIPFAYSLILTLLNILQNFVEGS